MLVEFQISSQLPAKPPALDFKLFYQSFLSRDAYDRALNGRSKLTSQ